MELEEIKASKQELEIAIIKLVENFEGDFGVLVDTISLSHDESFTSTKKGDLEDCSIELKIQ